MRPIDADALQTALVDEYSGISGYKTREGFYRAIEIVRQQPTISPPPNDPLTLEELRELGKDWVWIKLLVPLYRVETGYYVKHKKFSSEDRLCCGYPDIVMRDLSYADYGCDWLAYRRKPEEETL